MQIIVTLLLITVNDEIIFIVIISFRCYDDRFLILENVICFGYFHLGTLRVKCFSRLGLNNRLWEIICLYSLILIIIIHHSFDCSYYFEYALIKNLMEIIENDKE
jgi:hypothetical protein